MEYSAVGPASLLQRPAPDTQTAPANSVSVGLSGTYTIDHQRSESIDEIIADTKVTDDKRQDH